MLRRIMFLLVLVYSLSVFSATSCSAAVYLITDQELTRQEQNLAQLESNLLTQTDNYQNSKQMLQNSNELILTLQTRLQKVEQLLIRSDKQIVILQTKLTETQYLLSQTSTSLETVNKDLELYAKQVQSEIRKLKVQRAVLITVAAGIAYKYIQK